MGVKKTRRVVSALLGYGFAMVGLISFAACAGQGSLREPRRAVSGGETTTDSSWAASVRDSSSVETPRRSSSAETAGDASWAEATAANASAAESIEDELLNGDPVGKANEESVASKASDAALESGHGEFSTGSEPRREGPDEPPRTVDRRTAPRLSSAEHSYEIMTIAGHRSETRIRVDGWRGFSSGLRVGESFTTGFVGFEGRGLIRAVHVGQLTVRAGERLLLGRGLGGYGVAGSGSVRGGFTVSPSLSKWFGVTGAALELGRGFWRFQTLALSSSDGSNGFEPRCVWSSVVRGFSRGSMGIAAACSFPRSSRVVTDLPETRPPAVAWHSIYHAEGFTGSAEVAQLGGELFFAGRLMSQERESRWSFFVFRAPYEMPQGGLGTEPAARSDQGMTVRFSSRVARVKASASFSAGQVRSPSAQNAYRRLTARVENTRSGPVRWELCAYGKTHRGGDFPTHAVVRDIPVESGQDLTLRAAVWVRGADAVRTAVRIDYLPRTNGAGQGVLVALSTEFATGRADARLSLSGHSLAAGRPAFVSRPGLGPCEWFGSVYGRGSDLAVRLRVRLTHTVRVLAFYGSSWRGAERLYVGAEYHR